MNITVKDIPESLHKQLREGADRSGRSLNKFILHTLEQSILPTKTDERSLLQRIQRRRKAMTATIDDAFLAKAIKGGRR